MGRKRKAARRISRSKGPKMKAWFQRSPADVVDQALARAREDGAARALKLHKRNKLVVWLLDQFRSGKVRIEP